MVTIQIEHEGAHVSAEINENVPGAAARAAKAAKEFFAELKPQPTT